jgi:hypothetical protein
MYLQEGKMLFLTDIESLQDETGETRLSKVIARIMKGSKSNSSHENVKVRQQKYQN